MERTIKETFYSANILTVEVTHNGFQGGDAGHGGFVTIKLIDEGSTSMEGTVEYIPGDGYYPQKISFEEMNEVSLTFRGDTERDTLVQSLEFILKELKEYEYLEETTK